MMLLAHRGNLTGPSIHENEPDYLANAIDSGFLVEADIWGASQTLFLGHDGPQYLMPEEYIKRYGQGTIFHCKNLDALDFMRRSNQHFFWHQEDDYAFTSFGYIWAFPGKPVKNTIHYIIVNKNAIELPVDMQDVAGICTDYPQLFKIRL
jgi:hypothetical protein